MIGLDEIQAIGTAIGFPSTPRSLWWGLFDPCPHGPGEVIGHETDQVSPAGPTISLSHSAPSYWGSASLWPTPGLRPVWFLPDACLGERWWSRAESIAQKWPKVIGGGVAVTWMETGNGGLAGRAETWVREQIILFDEIIESLKLVTSFDTSKVNIFLLLFKLFWVVSRFQWMQ